MNIQPIIRKQAKTVGVSLSADAVRRLARYANWLISGNEVMNLTAVTDPEEIALRHFADSLSVLKAAAFPKGGAVIDVGTGAGFPGVPLAIARPDLEVALLDSQRKRIRFLREACEGCGLPLRFFDGAEWNEEDLVPLSARESMERLETATGYIRLLWGRAEEFGRQEKFRERFDCAVSRAVAPLNQLCELCLPFVKPGGVMIAMKGPEPEEEIRQAEAAMELLGGALEEVREVVLSPEHRHSLVVLRKEEPTPDKYPRRSARIEKNPL
jgi:16S rRNA (guanine527-N7)-methyltransferase